MYNFVSKSVLFSDFNSKDFPEPLLPKTTWFCLLFNLSIWPFGSRYSIVVCSDILIFSSMNLKTS